MVDEDVIVVVGVGTGHAEPDLVRAHIGVSMVAPTVSEALTNAAAAQSRIIEVLLAAGVDRTAIRTIGYQAGQDYETPGPSSRHRADVNLEVRLPDIDRVGRLLADVGETAGDGLRVRGIFSELSDPEPARTVARAAAVSAARAQAEELAAAAGVRLGRLRSLVEGGVVSHLQAHSMAGPMAGAPVPDFEPGRQTVQVAVTATYEIVSTTPS